MCHPRASFARLYPTLRGRGIRRERFRVANSEFHTAKTQGASSSLRGVKRRSNPAFFSVPRWIASLALAMTSSGSPRTPPRRRRVHRASFAGHEAHLKHQRAQGMPGTQCTRSLACENRKHTRSSPQVHRSNPAFPAQWFTTYIALSPVIGLVVTVGRE